MAPLRVVEVLDVLRNREEISRGLAAGVSFRQRWRDVTLDADPFIMVRHSLVRSKGAAPALAETKTRTSRGRMALPTRLVDLLRRHRTNQLEERLIAGPDWQTQADASAAV